MQTPREVTTPLAAIGRERGRMRTSDRVYSESVAAIRDLRLPPGASVSETQPAERLHVSRALELGPAIRAAHPGYFTE